MVFVCYALCQAWPSFPLYGDFEPFDYGGYSGRFFVECALSSRGKSSLCIQPHFHLFLSGYCKELLPDCAYAYAACLVLSQEKRKMHLVWLAFRAPGTVGYHSPCSGRDDLSDVALGEWNCLLDAEEL